MCVKIGLFNVKKVHELQVALKFFLLMLTAIIIRFSLLETQETDYVLSLLKIRSSAFHNANLDRQKLTVIGIQIIEYSQTREVTLIFIDSALNQ